MPTDFARRFDVSRTTFQRYTDALEQLRDAVEAAPDWASWHALGESEQGRPLGAVVLGQGAQRVSLMAGAHADEPVGPETLSLLVAQVLAAPHRFADVLRDYTLVILPHINPDGAALNRRWIDAWPDVVAFVRDVHREPPGRDLEFGYPRMRRENEAVARFLGAHGPFALHLSLHGMAFAEGGLLLIEPSWTDRVAVLKKGWRAALSEAGLPLHDHDRGGEKGFVYLGPGFTTTPQGRAMQAYFQARNEPEQAERFHLSSMEYVRSLGGDPLSLVTEIPLFLLPRQQPNRSGVPDVYLAWKAVLPEVRLRLAHGEDVGPILARFDPQPVPLRTALRLQLTAIGLGLDAVQANVN